ncbi:MAG: class I SAM-dependent methyltransferase [Methanoregula sp.]|jgi:O-methyltransferase involved in polyketide biosynthesis|nr:class I SAM-dependent methyltransferase [Methanoregula sp.]
MKKDKIRITLDNEKETLLVPLLCKAREREKELPILSDHVAARLVERIDYDFSALKIPKKTQVTLCIRAKQFDNYTRAFLDEHPSAVVIHMGCGLDTRYFRVTDGKVAWYDLDYPDVIALRRQFHDETDRYRLIPSSVMDFRWLDNLAGKSGPVLIIAEGLFMYLHVEEVRSLIIRLQQRFPGCLLIFDCFSAHAIKRMAGHPSIQKTGAEVHWGIDDAREIETWNKGITLLEEWYFTQSDEIRKLDHVYRILFKFAGLYPAAKKAHRIVAFRLN